MSPLLVLACVLLLSLALCSLLVLGWVLLCAAYDGLDRLRRGYEARSWSASASANRATAAPRTTSTECATGGASRADTATPEQRRAPNRTTARGGYTTGPRAASEAEQPRGDRTTVAELAQLIASGEIAPMPPWRSVGVEAGLDFDAALTELRRREGAA